MNKVAFGIGIVIVVIAVVIGVYALHNGQGSATYSTTTISYSTAPTTTSGNNTTTSVQSNATMFNNTQYAAHSYLISGNVNLSTYGAATSDFNLTSVTEANSTTIYTISYKDISASYNVTLKSGQKLYYIDMFPTDDSASDHTTADDGYAIVNATGYVISISYPISG